MSDSEKRMPLVELEKTQEYQKLTPKQKLFVATYCEGGMVDQNYDAVAATKTAYRCKTDEVARVMSYSMLQNVNIIAALNRHFQKAPIEEFLALVDRAIHNKRVTQAQIWALKLKCDILGFASRLPSTGTTEIGNSQESSAAPRKAKRKSKPPAEPKPEPTGPFGF